MPLEQENCEEKMTSSSITARGITSVLMIKTWQSHLMAQPTRAQALAGLVLRSTLIQWRSTCS